MTRRCTLFLPSKRQHTFRRWFPGYADCCDAGVWAAEAYAGYPLCIYDAHILRGFLGFGPHRDDHDAGINGHPPSSLEVTVLVKLSTDAAGDSGKKSSFTVLEGNEGQNAEEAPEPTPHPPAPPPTTMQIVASLVCP